MKSTEGSGWRSKRGGGSTAETKAYLNLYSWNLSRKITSRQADIVYFTFISDACFKLGRNPKEWQNQQNTNQASNQPEAKCHQQRSKAKKGDEKATETETKQTKKQEKKKERREIMLTSSESRDQQWLVCKLSVGAWHHKHDTSPRRILISSITFLPPPSASSPALQNTDRQTDGQTQRERQRPRQSATEARRGRKQEQQRGGVQCNSSNSAEQRESREKRVNANYANAPLIGLR